MKRVRTMVPAGTMLVGLAVVVISGCKKDEPAQPSVRPVRAMKVGDPTAFAGRSFSGRARAAQEVNLSFRVSGPLQTLPVNVGDVVKQGDVLAGIDPNDFMVRVRNIEGQLARAQAERKAMAKARPEEIEKLKARVKRAEAVLTRWEDEFKRIMGLKAQNAVQPIEITRTTEARDKAEATLATENENLRIGMAGDRPEDIEAKEAEIQSIEAALQASNDELGYTKLRAPFDGTVAATYVENYETVRTLQPILRLVDTSRIEMIVDIPENLISNAKYVTEAICRFDAFPDLDIRAKIIEVGTEASKTTRTYPVTLIMDQPPADAGAKILPGMAGTARGTGELPPEVAKAGIEVPSTALLHRDGRDLVWAIDEQAKTVKAMQVTPLELTPFGRRVQGLEPGTWIVTAGVHYLKDGQTIRILEEATP